MKQPYTQHVFLLFFWFAMANSAINPFVYAIQNQQYQQAYRSLLCGHKRRRAATLQGDVAINVSGVLCGCASKGSPNVTPASSKTSVNTMCVELKAINKIHVVEQLQVYPTDFCDNQ